MTKIVNGSFTIQKNLKDNTWEVIVKNLQTRKGFNTLANALEWISVYRYHIRGIDGIGKLGKNNSKNSKNYLT